MKSSSEAFCHGSLCYSYSGLCFFSGASDARSGNRGECAYTCRQPYKILNEPGHGFLFSMRDLDSSNDLGVLVGTGVDTLKIEGRKKDAQYVSTVVKLYRNRLDELFGRNYSEADAPSEAQAPLRPRKSSGAIWLSRFSATRRLSFSRADITRTSSTSTIQRTWSPRRSKSEKSGPGWHPAPY